MKQITFFLFIIICAAGIWLFLDNRPKPKRIEIAPRNTQKQQDGQREPKDSVKLSPTFDYEKQKQPTAAEKEILEWLKADGCKVENLGSLGYRISWTVRFHTSELPTVIAPDGYSVSVTGPDQNGNYLHVREYDYTWNPLLRVFDSKDLNPVGLTKIKRHRIDTKELR